MHIKYYLKKSHLNSYRISHIRIQHTKNRFTHHPLFFLSFFSCVCLFPKSKDTWMMIASSLLELLFSVRFEFWAVNKTVKQKLKLYLNKTLTQFSNTRRRRVEKTTHMYGVDVQLSVSVLFFWMFFCIPKSITHVHTHDWFKHTSLIIHLLFIINNIGDVFDFLLYNRR